MDKGAWIIETESGLFDLFLRFGTGSDARFVTEVYDPGCSTGSFCWMWDLEIRYVASCY